MLPAPDLHEAVEGRLRRAGQRYTTGRRRLVEALHNAGTPLTLPQLLEADDEMIQSSAYRNLAVLEQVEAVTKIVGAADHASFELAEDLTGHHHHHLVCADCGEVTDFSLASSTERTLDKVLAEVANDARYELVGHRLDVVGRCRRCR